MVLHHPHDDAQTENFSLNHRTPYHQKIIDPGTLVNYFGGLYGLLTLAEYLGNPIRQALGIDYPQVHGNHFRISRQSV
jgi:hypothetical protein